MEAKAFPAMDRQSPFLIRQIHLLMETHYSSLPVIKEGLQEIWGGTLYQGL